MKRKNRRVLGWLAVGAVVAFLATFAMGTRGQASSELMGSVFAFTDVREQTIEFHAYNHSITMTPEQQEVMTEALTALKAPCCSDRTALTCCCDCNMARSWWGLSKHLITDQGLGAEEVRTAVSEWFEFINPGGFSGNACYIGRCGQPFRHNGCGGMKEDNVIL